MQVKQRLRINAAVMTLSVISVLAVLVATALRVNRAMEANRTAEAIQTASFERLALRTDYMRTGSERAREQVAAKYRLIADLLKTAAAKSKDPEAQKTLSTLIENNESIGKNFRDIIANRKNAAEDGDPDGLSLEVEDRLLSQLNMRVYETLHLVGKLQESSNAALLATVRTAGGGIAIIFLLAGAVTLLNSATMNRAIAGRIGRLRQGAAMIGEGDLNHRIDIKGDDEFSELSRAFNAMTAQLSDSYRNLENEIDDRKRAEEALRENEERLRTMFERHKAIMLLIEPDSGAIVDANASAVQFYRRSREELCSLKIQEINLMSPDEVASQRIKATQGQQDHFIFPHLLGTGETRWVEVYSTPVVTHGSTLLFSIIHDITERRKAEEALRESEERFRVAQELSPDGFTILHPLRDDRGGIIDFIWVYENAAIARMNGTDPSSVPGKRLLDVIPGHAGSPFHAVYQQVAESGRSSVLEAPFHGENMADEKWFRVAVVPSGQDIAILAQDITERKRTEEEIKASLHEKEVLLKEVHHRVKNNLQVISSLVSLQADGSRDETVRTVLRDVTDRVRSMALVHEKLYQSHDLAYIDFAEYIKSLLGYLWRAHGATAAAVSLTLELQPVSLPVDTAVPCGLILNELVGNALKHAFRGRAEGEVAVTLHGTDDGRIRLSVADNGAGLPEGLDWRRANSLGLRLVQMLAGQLGGGVEVSGGAGTCFEITFSRGAAESAEKTGI